MKCGFVSLVGRPNVGKITLLNSVLGMKLAITSNVSGTTRNVIQGIYNDSDSQIVFVDTPGIHKPTHKLGSLMNKKAYNNTEGVDVILFLVDIFKGFGRGDQFILDKIKDKGVPVFLLLNKIDQVKNKENLLNEINKLKELYDFAEIIPISAMKHDNVDLLVSCIKKHLDEQEAIFSEDDLTNVSTRFIMAEFLREKILELTHDEIPHTVTCYVENYEEYDEVVHIKVLVVVDRDNIKKIIIGKGGSMLKEIGTRARYDMEKFLGKKVFLETYVKTLKNWRDQEKYFLELQKVGNRGYTTGFALGNNNGESYSYDISKGLAGADFLCEFQTIDPPPALTGTLPHGEGNYFPVKIKNKMLVGDEVEIITSDEQFIATVEAVKNADGEDLPLGNTNDDVYVRFSQSPKNPEYALVRTVGIK